MYFGGNRIYCSEGLQDIPLVLLVKEVWRQGDGPLGSVKWRMKPLFKLYTGCPRRNGQNFGRVFLMLNYTDITQNTYIQS